MSEPTAPIVTAFESLAREVAEYASKTARVSDKPTSDDARLIIETVFFASIAREEGRPLQLRVGFVAPDGPARPVTQSWGWWVLPFESSLPFEKNELVKLAPSVDSRQSFIAVTRNDAGLRIWGLINLGASNIDLHEGKTSRATTIGPEFVDVGALAPGVLDVKIGLGWSRRFSDGHIDDLLAYPFRYGGPLSDIIKYGSAAARMTPGLWERTLRRVLGEIQRTRHGGTLLLHAGSERKWSDHGLRMKCRVHGEGLALSDACHRASSREDTFNDDHARMGQAVTEAEISHASVAEERDWKPFPWNRFGTRHQSAAAFCRSHQTSAAIVVSHDGVISLFRWYEGRVVIWRPCEILDPGARSWRTSIPGRVKVAHAIGSLHGDARSRRSWRPRCQPPRRHPPHRTRDRQ